LESFLNADPAIRKILIIEDEPSIRNLLYVLLAGLGCEGDVAYTGQQALAMVSRERFDAVLLDLRCTNLEADHVVSEITELRPNLVDRVLVITGEVTDPGVMEWVEKQCLPHVKSNRLMQELLTNLQQLLGLSNSPKAAS
jgi:DNA-binding NtrC family response regulator